MNTTTVKTGTLNRKASPRNKERNIPLHSSKA
jgi:hypothetical protein